MESSVSPRKLRKYRWQTPIWASISTPVAPSVLISSWHSPRSGGGAEFSFGGHKQSFGGHGPGMPPRGAGRATAVCKYVNVRFHHELDLGLQQK